MSLKDWGLNWQTVTFDSLVKTIYVAIPNINSAGEYTHLQRVKLQSHMSESKDGGRDEELKTVVHSTTLTVHGGKQQFFSPYFQTTNIVVRADTHALFPDISIAKVTKYIVLVCMSVSCAQGSRFHLFWSLELNKEILFTCFLFDFFWKLLLFFPPWLYDVMVMLLHKGSRYLFHAENACLNLTWGLGAI